MLRFHPHPDPSRLTFFPPLGKGRAALALSLLTALLLILTPNFSANAEQLIGDPPCDDLIDGPIALPDDPDENEGIIECSGNFLYNSFRICKQTFQLCAVQGDCVDESKLLNATVSSFRVLQVPCQATQRCVRALRVNWCSDIYIYNEPPAAPGLNSRSICAKGIRFTGSPDCKLPNNTPLPDYSELFPTHTLGSCTTC